MGVRRGAEEIPLVLLQLPLSGAAPPGAPEFPEPPRKPPGRRNSANTNNNVKIG